MSNIIWQDPPTDRTAKGAYVRFFDELRCNPGKWALWPNSPCTTSTGTRIKDGTYFGAAAGEFDARSVGRGDGKADIYVRYPAPLEPPL